MQTPSEHIYLQQMTISSILMATTHSQLLLGINPLTLTASRSLSCFIPKQCETKHSDFFCYIVSFGLFSLFSLHHKHTRSADTAAADRGCKHISSEVTFSIRLAWQQRQVLLWHSTNNRTMNVVIHLLHSSFHQQNYTQQWSMPRPLVGSNELEKFL